MMELVHGLAGMSGCKSVEELVSQLEPWSGQDKALVKVRQSEPDLVLRRDQSLALA